MKPLILILISAGAGALLSGLIVHSSMQSAHDRQIAEQKQVYSKKLADHRKSHRKVPIQQIHRFQTTSSNQNPPAGQLKDSPAVRTPGQIIEAFIRLGDDSNRTKLNTMRQLVVLTEELVGHGPAALPAIEKFLKRQEELDFNYSLNQGSLDFLLPPTLRLGLFNVLYRIGGTEAERVLVNVIDYTARPIEIFYLALTLEKMAGKQYKDAVLKCTHEVLSHKPEAIEEKPSRLNQNHRSLLFGILTKYNDHTFVATARKQAINPKGEVDEDALNYLNDALNEKIMPDIQSFMNHPSLTVNAKGSLLKVAKKHIGKSSIADDMVMERIHDAQKMLSQPKNEDEREIGLFLLLQYVHSIANTNPKSKLNPLEFENRRKLLTRLKSTYPEDDMQKLISRAEARLLARKKTDK